MTNYLDFNATTPVHPDVFKEMTPYFTERYGNPASIYSTGRESLKAIQEARGHVAKFLQVSEREIVFTSGGTESNNLAIRSALKLNPTKKTIVTSSVEHSSVRNVCKALEKEGIKIVQIPVNADGALDLKVLETALTADVALTSFMWANNETGVIFPIEEIAKLVKSHGILFHVDAVQAVGKVKIDLSKIPVDLLSLSAHKFYGPKGIGALFVRNKIALPALLFGGHQERERRAGTENVPGIVGLGKAIELLGLNFEHATEKISILRDRLEKSLLQAIPDSFLNGGRSPRVSNTTNIIIPGVSAEVLIPRLDEEGICVSSGSACLTGALEPSFVLRAMGHSEANAMSSIRLSLGYTTKEEDIDRAIKLIPKTVETIRQIRKKEMVQNG